MNFVDIIIFACILAGVLLGYKNGLVKTLVELIGSVCIIILAYVLKDILADFLMGFMPFLNFAGAFNGLSSTNIIMYQIVSFVLIFVVLYCILNILINLSGIVDKILKLTIIMRLPSKVLGALVGVVEGVYFAFLVTFILFSLSFTTAFVDDSKFGKTVLEKTPFVNQVLAPTTLALEEINPMIKEYEDKDLKNLNTNILTTLIYYNLVSKKDAADFIKNKKIDLENVVFN